MEPKIHCLVHMGFVLVPILRDMNPIPIVKHCFFKIHFNIILPSTCEDVSKSFRTESITE